MINRSKLQVIRRYEPDSEAQLRALLALLKSSNHPDAQRAYPLVNIPRCIASNFKAEERPISARDSDISGSHQPNEPRSQLAVIDGPENDEPDYASGALNNSVHEDNIAAPTTRGRFRIIDCAEEDEPEFSWEVIPIICTKR